LDNAVVFVCVAAVAASGLEPVVRVADAVDGEPLELSPQDAGPIANSDSNAAANSRMAIGLVLNGI
jgi:hypothetical protein